MESHALPVPSGLLHSPTQLLPVSVPSRVLSLGVTSTLQILYSRSTSVWLLFQQQYLVIWPPGSTQGWNIWLFSRLFFGSGLVALLDTCQVGTGVTTCSTATKAPAVALCCCIFVGHISALSCACSMDIWMFPQAWGEVSQGRRWTPRMVRASQCSTCNELRKMRIWPGLCWCWPLLQSRKL